MKHEKQFDKEMIFKEKQKKAIILFIYLTVGCYV